MKKIIIFAICLAVSMAISLPSLAIELSVKAVRDKKVPASYATLNKKGEIVYGKHGTAWSPGTFDRVLKAYELTLEPKHVNDLKYPRYAKVQNEEIVFGESPVAYDPGTYHRILSAYGLILPLENARALKDPPNYVKVINDKLVFGTKSTAYSPEEFNMVMNAYILPDKPCTDSDGDGVCDDKDKCPGTPRGSVVDKDGCPPEITESVKVPCPDADGDGICDDEDKCPDTPEGATVNEDGCEPVIVCPDEDGDGVCDVDDDCPGTPKGTSVDERGCPKVIPSGPIVCPDEDNDGVCDEKDACLGTPKGAFVNERGCWIIENLLFDFDKSVIKPKYYSDLDEVARVLKENPDLVVEIQGHTCWVGTDRYNQGLSDRRAKAVVKYLEEKGINPARLNWQGYGEARPAFENTTREGRIKNRRVELAPKP